MARYVRHGFVTFDGRYFEDENSAKVYETEHKLVSAFLEINNHPDPDDLAFKNRYAALKAFIHDYHDLLTEYIDARRESWTVTEGESANEVRRQSATGDQSNDLPLRPSSDSKVDEDEPAEADTPSRRKRPK